VQGLDKVITGHVLGLFVSHLFGGHEVIDHSEGVLALVVVHYLAKVIQSVQESAVDVLRELDLVEVHAQTHYSNFVLHLLNLSSCYLSGLDSRSKPLEDYFLILVVNCTHCFFLFYSVEFHKLSNCNQSDPEVAQALLFQMIMALVHVTMLE